VNVAQLIEWAQREPWAISEEALAAIANVLMLQATGQPVPIEAWPQVKAAAPAPRSKGAIAIIPIYGPTVKREDFWTKYFGGATYEGIAAMVKTAAENPDVGTILLDIDSPGGLAVGCDEVANVIYEARTRKRIIAAANGGMTSAAYYYGSAAHEVVASPDAQVGSIGTMLLHLDFSEAYKMAGIKPTIVTSAARKAEFHEAKPLTEEEHARLQEVVNHYNAMFVKSVARNRGVSEAKVKQDFGEGAVLLAPEAKKAGLIDRIETLNQTIQRLGGARFDPSPAFRSIASGIEMKSSDTREKDQTIKGGKMDKKLREILGLADDADDAAIEAAVAELKAKATAVPVEDAAATTEIEALRRDLADSDKKIVDLQGALAQAEAERQVEAAMQSGKLVPRQREYAMKVALRGSAEFSEYLKALPPKAIDFSERGSTGEAVDADGMPVDMSQLEPTAQEVEVAQKSGIWTPEFRETLIRQKAFAAGVTLPADFGTAKKEAAAE